MEKRVVGLFDFRKTGAGNNSGFEAMCYINEKPYQGVDLNHQEVFSMKQTVKNRFLLPSVSGPVWKAAAFREIRNTESWKQSWHGLMKRQTTF